MGQLVPKPNPAFLLERYSSLDKLLGVTGWIKRFVNNCRKPQAERNFTPVLSPAERNAALCSLVRVVQAEHFEEEVLYTRIAVGLWQSSHGLQHLGRVQCCASQCPKIEKPTTTPDNFEPQRTFIGNTEAKILLPQKSTTTNVTKSAQKKPCRNVEHNCHHLSHLSRNVLRARRGVVRMLIVVVLTFAVCNLPFHARKMWQYWSSGYQGTSDFSALLTPLTFLITYFNSGINPLLYAFLSKNFRKGMRELLFCNIHGKRKSENLIVLNAVGGMGLRRSSTRSTRANCSTITMAPHGES
ncbi:7 transmembrane receptor (rhodopsin family) domain-containing protein [Phthorimaea operculella]|nr:7 transmembrane receptor (rhodopsin family) domain-containing protein [Phthorimaea operculella]